MKPLKPKIIVYLPVIHAGYLHLCNSYPEADIFIANESLIELIDHEFDYLRKEIRSITPQQAEVSLEALLPNRAISLIGANDLAFLDRPQETIYLPKEDIFLWLAKEHLSKCIVHFEPTFLRWNRENTIQKLPINASNTSSKSKLSQKITHATKNLKKTIIPTTKTNADLSSDWWRQVGAVVFKEETRNKSEAKQSDEPNIIAIAHNHHLPSPYSPYIDSDPRNSFHKGEHIDLSTAIHAEAALIADAAKKGNSLAGTSMYVSTFPCPVCAKQIAVSGITKLYYSDGYAVLDGERILKDVGVEIIKVV